MLRVSSPFIQSIHRSARIGYTTLATPCTLCPNLASSRIVLDRVQRLRSNSLTAPVLSSLSVDFQSVMLSRDNKCDDMGEQVFNHLDMMDILTQALKAGEDALLAHNKAIEKRVTDLEKDVSDWKNDMQTAFLDLQKSSNRTSLALLHSQCLTLINDLVHAHQTNPKQISFGHATSALQLYNKDRIDASHVIRSGERYDSAFVRAQIRAYVEAASELIDQRVEDVLMIEEWAQLSTYTEILKEVQIHGDTFFIDPPHAQYKSKLV